MAADDVPRDIARAKERCTPRASRHSTHSRAAPTDLPSSRWLTILSLPQLASLAEVCDVTQLEDLAVAESRGAGRPAVIQLLLDILQERLTGSSLPSRDVCALCSWPGCDSPIAKR